MVKESVKRCSHCGKDGHNLRTCIENDKECLMLFGVNILQKKQITGESMKKSCSMINISSCDIENKNGDKEDPEAGYLSDGLVHSKRRKATHDRRKGKAWTEEEHRVFLSGLKQLGKGDWKGISRSFVTTRTPTQVASHAQKYFLRLGAHEKKRRRPSLFDIPLSLSHQNETHKDSRDLPLRKTFKSSLEPRSSQIMTTTSTVEKTRQQSIDKNKMVNQFPHLCMDDSTAIPVAASTCFQNYEVLTSTVKRPSNMYFAHFAFPKPAVYPHLPKIHGNLDVFPVISHPSGIPSPQYPVSRSSSQGSHGESQSHPGRQSAHFRTTAPLV